MHGTKFSRIVLSLLLLVLIGNFGVHFSNAAQDRPKSNPSPTEDDSNRDQKVNENIHHSESTNHIDSSFPDDTLDVLLTHLSDKDEYESQYVSSIDKPPLPNLSTKNPNLKSLISSLISRKAKLIGVSSFENEGVLFENIHNADTTHTVFMPSASEVKELDELINELEQLRLAVHSRSISMLGSKTNLKRGGTSNLHQIFDHLLIRLNHLAKLVTINEKTPIDSHWIPSPKIILAAHAHYLLAKIHFGALLPFFPVQPAHQEQRNPWDEIRRNIFLGFDYEYDAYHYDWLVELIDAFNEDTAMDEDFTHSKHYLPLDLATFSPIFAVFHLKQAANLGHPSSQILIPMIIEMVIRHEFIGLPSEPDYKMPKSDETFSIQDNEHNVNFVHGQFTNVNPYISKYYEVTSNANRNRYNRNKRDPSYGVNESEELFLFKPIDLEPTHSTFSSLALFTMRIYANFSSKSKSLSSHLFEAYHSNHGIGGYLRSCTRSRILYLSPAKTVFHFNQQSITTLFPFSFAPLLEQQDHPGLFRPQSSLSRISNQDDIMQLYEYHAKSGNKHAALTMGISLLRGGMSMKRDYKGALDYFLEASNIDPLSCAYVGYMYENGYGIPEPDLKKATYYYNLAGDNDFAQMRLGLILLKQGEFNDAFKLLMSASKQKNANALFITSSLLMNIGKEENNTIKIQQAIEFLQHAVSLNHIGAMLKISTLTHDCYQALSLFERIFHTTVFLQFNERANQWYHSGKEHLPQALWLYNFGASLGDTYSLRNAAYVYSQHNPDRPSDLYLNSSILEFLLQPMNPDCLDTMLTYSTLQLNADQGQQGQQKLLPRQKVTPCGPNILFKTSQRGKIYIEIAKSASSPSEEETGASKNRDSPSVTHSSVISKDPISPIDPLSGPMKFKQDNQRIGFNLYRFAAQQGVANGFLKLGDFYYYGHGVPVNYEMAALHYMEASQGLDSQASFNVGYMYQRGQGLPQDYVLAKNYYELALRHASHAYLPCKVVLIFLWLEKTLMEMHYSSMSWDERIIVMISFVLVLLYFIRGILKYLAR